MKCRKSFRVAVPITGLMILAVAVFAGAGQAAAAAEGPLLVHVLGDANKGDANHCVAFNLVWVAVEKGQSVEMLFDSMAGYNIKEEDYWAKYQVPENYRHLVAETVGGEIDWSGGSYLELLRYLHGKGLVVSANKTFLALSGDDVKLPPFVNQLSLAEMVDHVAGAGSYVAY